MLPGWRHRQGLAKVLLWQPEQSTVFRPAPIESLDDQHFGPSECLGACFVDRQAKNCEKPETVIVILNAVGKIKTIRQLAYLRLEYVRGRCCAAGPDRAVVMP